MNTKHVARAPLAVQLSNLPAVEKLLQADSVQNWIESYGRDEVLRAIRQTLKQARESILACNGEQAELNEVDHLNSVSKILIGRSKSKMRQVINLTGTVLHTNLGRAVMPPDVVQAIALAASEPCALEYDLGEGKRGDRDELVEEMLCELTGFALGDHNDNARVDVLPHCISLCLVTR
jgi:L-seryl-tRNA(Ser) seleniumtransferase